MLPFISLYSSHKQRVIQHTNYYSDKYRKFKPIQPLAPFRPRIHFNHCSKKTFLFFKQGS